MQNEYVYNAVLRSIYDADTIRVDIDLGFGTCIHNEPIRLMGINAPEIRGEERPQGLESKAWLEERIQPGDKIVIQTVKDTKGKYGRYLAWVYVGDVNINELMVEQGYAVKAEY